MFIGDLHSALNDYELLHHTSFRHHIRKRDLYSHDPDALEVEYNSFGRLLLVEYPCVMNLLLCLLWKSVL